MPSPWLYALTVGPLGVYLWALATWHGDAHPRVVSGLLDHLLLCFGIGGVLAFGPFGQFVVLAISATPSLVDWLCVLSGLALVAALTARRSLARLVVYHVDPSTLASELAGILESGEGGYRRTLAGFENPGSRRGLAVDVSPWLRAAVIEAYGQDAAGVIEALRPKLRERLARIHTGRSPAAALFRGLSILVLVIPPVTLALNQPRAREAFRALFERLRGA